MTRCGLSEAEEKHMLLLLEGDLSDIDIDSPDDSDGDEIVLPNLDPAGLSNGNVINDIVNSSDDQVIQLSNQISVEIETKCKNIEVSSKKSSTEAKEDWDSDDEIPLAQMLGQGSQYRPITKSKKNRKILQWKMKDIEKVNSDCEVSFTRPDKIRTPLEYFKMFFDDDIINNIVNQTNLYSVQKHGASVNTNFSEMCNYFGIHILSGIIPMPSYRMYWAQQTRYPLIADVMARNRFEKLRSNLHITNNDNMKNRGDPDYDKLFKVRPLIEALKTNFSKIEPEENNSVDEIMIPFKGNSSLKQYIKSKPHKWGIKLFARAGISGIIYEFEVYVGKGTAGESTELGISGDIVLKMCSNLPKNRNFKVFIDNYFTSYDLLVTLKSMGILSVGTVRVNRLRNYKPKDDKDLKKEGRGSFDYFTECDENIVAVKWHDNKSVNLVSSYVGIEPIGTVKRWSQTDRKYIDINRPHIVEAYNTNMGGVDLCDMLVALYRTKIGVKRFYLKILFHLMDICIVNSWLLYRRDCSAHNITKYKKLIEFRSEIAEGMLRCYTVARKRGRPATSREGTPPSREGTPVTSRGRPPIIPKPIDDVRFDEKSHWPSHIEPKMRCRECKSYTRMACDKCKVPLCITKDRNCFVKFHKA